VAAPASRSAGLSRPHSTARFFASTRALFGAAAAATGTTDRHYELAGRSVLVRSAGSELDARTDPALQLRRIETDDEPELVVEMWDSAASGIEMPRAPWQPMEAAPLGLVRSYCDERFLTAIDIHTASVSAYDREQAHAVFWLRDARKMAYWQSASPLRLILSWWASTRGMQLTHAGGVAGPDGAVLLVGGAGAGKSTTALACLDAGFDFFGDDYCLVTPDPEPWVHGVYATAKARPEGLPLIPGLRSVARNVERFDREKAVLDLAERYGAQMIAGAPVRAIVAPRVSDRVSVEPITPGAALRAMAPSTIFGLFGATPGTLHLLADVARRVPAYRLEVCDDLDAVVDAVGSIAAGSR
jgi:hypothetical protein